MAPLEKLVLTLGPQLATIRYFNVKKFYRMPKANIFDNLFQQE